MSTGSEVRRTKRVTVGALHEIGLRIVHQGETLEASILNISYGGVGFRALHPFQKGEVLSAVVMLHEKSFDIQLNVEHTTPTLVGTSFASYSPELILALGEYFNAEIQGLSLAEVNENLLKHSDEGRSHLFRAAENCEIFYIESNGRLVRFEIVFYGNYIEGEPGASPKFGYLDEAPINPGLHHRGATLVQSTDFSDSETILEIRRFLENAEKIPKLIIGQILEIIDSMSE